MLWRCNRYCLLTFSKIEAPSGPVMPSTAFTDIPPTSFAAAFFFINDAKSRAASPRPPPLDPPPPPPPPLAPPRLSVFTVFCSFSAAAPFGPAVMGTVPGAPDPLAEEPSALPPPLPASEPDELPPLAAAAAAGPPAAGLFAAPEELLAPVPAKPLVVVAGLAAAPFMDAAGSVVVVGIAGSAGEFELPDPAARAASAGNMDARAAGFVELAF